MKLRGMPVRGWSRVLEMAAVGAAMMLAPAMAGVEGAATQPATQAATQPATQKEEEGSKAWSLAPVVVTAEKREEEAQKVPTSLSPITSETIKEADIKNILDASAYAPDVNVSHFTNPRLSFPYIRGVGSGENAPAVTTNYDGVPQLSFRTSSIELIDIHDIEFIRGPQGTLYGRNSLGGVINVNSNPPTNKLSIESTSTYGNYQFYDERATVNLPLIKDVLEVRVSGGASARNGYTTNDVTGNDVDSKEAEFGKMQIWFAPSDQMDFTLRMNGERDRDGDYPLGDLAAIRANPWHVAHGFEGDSLRDLAGVSLTANYYTEHATFTSVSGYQYWRSQDITGLDYTPFDLIRRQNRELENDYTQELRAASPTDRPIVITDQAKLKWVAGVFVFGSDYGQTTVNSFSPTLVFLEKLPFTQQLSNSAINNVGMGTFGQGTLTLFDKLDLIAGVRFDAERDHANLNSSTDTGTPPGSGQQSGVSFDNVSTRWGLAYHWTPELMSYGTAAQGYKAGGFNATAPSADKTTFSPDTDWTYEVGTKASWLKNRLTLNVDYFYVDWRNMQLDIPLGPGAAYVDNVGQAHSQGVEFEGNAKPTEYLEVFGGMAYMQSQFDTTIPASGIKQGNDLPFAPDITWNVGSEYSLKLCKEATAFVRAEEVGATQYYYDAQNGAAMGAYAMTNFRVGVKGRHWRVEGWMENAFNAHTVPMAFQYQQSFAPSGYIGENGIPRIYGVTLRIDF